MANIITFPGTRSEIELQPLIVPNLRYTPESYQIPDAFREAALNAVKIDTKYFPIDFLEWASEEMGFKLSEEDLLWLANIIRSSPKEIQTDESITEMFGEIAKLRGRALRALKFRKIGNTSLMIAGGIGLPKTAFKGRPEETINHYGSYADTAYRNAANLQRDDWLLRLTFNNHIPQFVDLVYLFTLVLIKRDLKAAFDFVRQST